MKGKKYVFIELYKKAYPSLERKTSIQLGKTYGTKTKKISKKMYEKTVLELKEKAAKNSK